MKMCPKCKRWNLDTAKECMPCKISREHEALKHHFGEFPFRDPVALRAKELARRMALVKAERVYLERKYRVIL